VLWRIVESCLDPGAPGYCERCPAPVGAACGERPCARTTQVWAEEREYVAIRDLKMCACPAGFVHGLALPRTRVTGVEDPRRPPGIWAFAWGVARERIPREDEIALVVNPRQDRTQDQLHVHIVRLGPGARERVTAAAARVADLGDVWDAAARSAQERGLADYGVLVTRDAGGAGFLVLAQRASPESDFTAASCR
jgi:CDP-diacylglycerol pyrophosphatase